MKSTASRVLLDSSAWLDYFLVPNSKIHPWVESENEKVFSSVISIHEVKKKLLKEQKLPGKIEDALEFMKTNSTILPVTEDIAEKSVKDCLDYRLHTTDALIYRTAQEHQATLITRDNDFQQTQNTIIV